MPIAKARNCVSNAGPMKCCAGGVKYRNTKAVTMLTDISARYPRPVHRCIAGHRVRSRVENWNMASVKESPASVVWTIRTTRCSA